MARQVSVTQARNWARKNGYKMQRNGIYLRKKFICKGWRDFIKMFGPAIAKEVNDESKKTTSNNTPDDPLGDAGQDLEGSEREGVGPG